MQSSFTPVEISKQKFHAFHMNLWSLCHIVRTKIISQHLIARYTLKLCAKGSELPNVQLSLKEKEIQLCVNRIARILDIVYNDKDEVINNKISHLLTIKSRAFKSF